MRMARLPVMEVGNYHLKNDDGSGLVKDSQRSLDRRLPVEQGGRKPPGEAAAAADDDKLAPSGQMQTFSLRSTGTNE